MNPWIIAGVGWALALIPICFIAGSFIRAGMRQREKDEYRSGHRATQSFGFVEHAEPGIEWHD